MQQGVLPNAGIMQQRVLPNAGLILRLRIKRKADQHVSIAWLLVTI